MAIYRMSIDIVSRSKGQSICAKAAYNAAEKMRDFYYNNTQDYSRKQGTVFSTILAPENAPDWARDREQLWNAVEQRETYGQGVKPASAQLARNIELALPRELSLDAQKTLVTGYVNNEYVSHGMVADIAIHHVKASDGELNPHAHVLLTMRVLDDSDKNGFGRKGREWNPQFTKGDYIKDKDKIIQDRGTWAAYVNMALEDNNSSARVDHRSNTERGLFVEPEPKLGKAAYDNSPESEARRTLQERTRWMNKEWAFLDRGKWQDIHAEMEEAEYQSRAFYHAQEYDIPSTRVTDIESHNPDMPGHYHEHWNDWDFER